MSRIIRFGVAMEGGLLERFDRLVFKKGYQNRSEAIRDLVRANLVEEDWKIGNQETVGTITIVYSHHIRELNDALTELQHRYHAEIVSCMHVHLDAHNCLEVLAVKGRPGKIKKIADSLIAVKGVKHGKLVMTTMGRDL